MTFSGERSHNASRLRATCGLLVLPALVEAGFQENPMARIFVFGERHWTPVTPNNKILGRTYSWITAPIRSG